MRRKGEKVSERVVELERRAKSKRRKKENTRNKVSTPKVRQNR